MNFSDGSGGWGEGAWINVTEKLMGKAFKVMERKYQEMGTFLEVSCDQTFNKILFRIVCLIVLHGNVLLIL